MNKQKIVIVGGGFAGVKLALELADKEQFEVVLVSDSPYFQYHAALYRSATGKSPLEVVLPLSRIFRNYNNIELVEDKLIDISSDHQQIRTANGHEIGYDRLVLALGQQSNFYGIRGIAEDAFGLDTIQNTINLRMHLHRILKLGLRHEHIVIIGAGASGVELAGELRYYLDNLCDKHAVESQEIKITLIEGSDRVLPLLKPKASKLALKRLQKIGVKVHLSQRVTSYENSELQIGDKKLKSQTVVWVAGYKNNQFFADHDHLFNISKNGRVKVNRHLEAFNKVFVIGDGADTKYSGMAQTALADAGFLATNFSHQHQKGYPKKYRAQKPIYVVPTGGKTAVVQWGKVIVSGQLGWILRRLADLRLFKEFEPLKQSIKDWRAGNRQAEETCPVCLVDQKS